MIDPHYARTMARYNAWQNRSLYAAAAGLADAERRRDRGAFWRSIHGTLGHVLWGDRMWMSRWSDMPRPAGGAGEPAALIEDWDALARQRMATDLAIEQWAGALTPADLEGDLRWFSGVLQREFARPRWLLVTHMFNHQTHHRGQVHAMLTAAGAKPEDTDLAFMEG